MMLASEQLLHILGPCFPRCGQTSLADGKQGVTVFSLFASPWSLLVFFFSSHFPFNEIILISSQKPFSFHHIPPPAGCVGVQLSSRMKPPQEAIMYFTEKKLIWGPCFTANLHASSPGLEAAYSHCSGSLSLDTEWKTLGIRTILIKLAL